MGVQLNPYLNFRDSTREAMTFYQTVFGGDLTVSTFGDIPEVPTGPEENDKVMHSMLRTDNGLVLMAADIPSYMEASANGNISLSGDDEATLRGYWEKLSDGGTVGMPLDQAPWGDIFGMVTDRFGVNWLVNIVGPNHPTA